MAGQRLTIVSVGTGQVDLSNQDSSSSAANRIINGVTGTISLAAGYGRVDLEYDATTQRWRVINHEQGAYIAIVYAAGDFTGNGSMTWAVDSGDVLQFQYYLKARRMSVNVFINNTTVGGTLDTELRVKIPAGFTSLRAVNTLVRVVDAGAAPIIGLMAVLGGQTNIVFYRALNTTTNWSSATNNTAVFGMLDFEVQ